MTSHNEKECLFCLMTPDRVVMSNRLAYAIHDGYPVTKLHSLVIPKRHASTYFDITADELLACDDLLRKLRTSFLSSDPSIVGFNIGLNAGEVAGQTIFHCHFHLIPRRRGDVENPRGGVRHLIPGKGYY